MDSGNAPLLIAKDQLSFAQNISLHGGFAQPRPPLQKKALDFGGDSALKNLVLTGKFQGGGYYRPDFGVESLIAQIAGHLLKFTESGSSWSVTDISIPGDLNDVNVSQVWMWQAEKWMIVQDGTGKLPIFYDGVTSRRSFGPSVLLGTTGADFTPPSIGGTVTLTLTAPYAGPYDVPVILNGEFYQPTKNASGYSVILTNVNGTPGAGIASGSAVVIQPTTVGFTTAQAVSFGGAGTLAGPANMTQAALDSMVNNQTVSILCRFSTDRFFHLSPPTIQNFIFIKGSAPGDVEFKAQFFCTSWIIDAGTAVTTQTSSPNVIVGYTTASLSTPAVGQSITAILTSPYSGEDGQLVFINGKAFTISLPPSSGGGTNSLIVINLTDGSAVPAVAPKTIMSVPELPAGRQGAYGMGCNCCTLTDGISYIIGDVIGSGAGTQANNYRDAVLKVTQNDFLFGGGSFHIPGTGETISAVIFPPNLDTSLGQGPLQIGTPFSFFTNVVPGTDPAGWAALKTPIQTESLKDNGPLGQNSTISVNSDTFFRSNIGIGSLVLARRAFQGWGNKPISHEVSIILDADAQELLVYGSSISFGNRFQTTTNPISSPTGIVHRGMVSINFDLISTLRQQSPPAWEGLMTGLNIFQAISGRVNGRLRSFAFSYNFLTAELEIYEFLPENSASFADNDTTPIVWAFETPVVFNADIKSLNELIQLRDAEIYLSDIQGNVTVQVYYRPDFYPCWTKWNEFSVCSSLEAINSKSGYRMRIGLGQPSVEDCEIGNNRPLRLGYFFQLRVVITGSCVWKGIRVKSVTVPQPEFAPIICETQDCQEIACDLPDPYALYTLQGSPPVVPVPGPTPELPFANNTTYLTNYCANGLPYFFGTNLPPWVTVDTANNQIIGAAGMFRGATQEAADAAGVIGLTAAIAGLNIQCGFYNTQQIVTCSDLSTQTIAAGIFFSTVSQADANAQAVALGNVQCANPACAGTDTGKYKITGYYDGLFFAGGDAGTTGDVPWDGTFQFKKSACEWSGVAAWQAGTILISGKKICATIGFHNAPDEWILSIWSNVGGACYLTWEGLKLKGSSPSGVYQRDNGPGAPQTITVVPM